jgi:hypothetical protein
MSPLKKAWSYILVTPAANLAVPLADVKTWLKVTGTAQDAEITSLIKSATQTGENITKRDFINKTYKTFRDNFSDYSLIYSNYAPLIPRYSRQPIYGLSAIELGKSKLQVVNSVKYLKDDVLTLVDSSIYYVTEETAFSSILLVDGESWPTDVDAKAQAVEIEFVAGYGVDSDSVPDDIKLAIKVHVANVFRNRGDCADDSMLPPQAKNIYMNNRILDIAV